MSSLRISIPTPPERSKRKIWRGWFPASTTLWQILEWAKIKRYPIPTRKLCWEFHGKDCQPTKAYVKITKNEIVIRTGSDAT